MIRIAAVGTRHGGGFRSWWTLVVGAGQTYRFDSRGNSPPKSIGVRYRLGGGLRPPHPALTSFRGEGAPNFSIFAPHFWPTSELGTGPGPLFLKEIHPKPVEILTWQSTSAPHTVLAPPTPLGLVSGWCGGRPGIRGLRPPFRASSRGFPRKFSDGMAQN